MDHLEIEETLEIYDAVDRGSNYVRERAAKAASRGGGKGRRG